MTERVLHFNYNDYTLDSQEIIILHEKVIQFVSNLKEQCTVAYEKSDLSTEHCWHIAGTQEQSKCEKWFMEKTFRVTASNITDIVANPSKKCAELWKKSKMNLSCIPAISWGKNHENEATLAYEKKSANSVKKCGLFVSKKYPFLGATPDGILSDTGILEIKCPFLLRNVEPWDLSVLDSAQKRTFFCSKNTNCISLKRSHKYYTQVQMQMFVTGRKFADFVVWTTKSTSIERIPYDPNHILPIVEMAKKCYYEVFVPEYYEQRIPRHLKTLKINSSL